MKQIWQKEEKEEPSGKMNLTSPRNIPCQTSSPHRTELSCESCLSDGQSSALPESHTGTSLSTLSATVRFWVQIFWSEPGTEIRMMDRDQNTFTRWSPPANPRVIECGARFSKKALTVAPAKPARMQTIRVVHKWYILACKIYQKSDASTTVCFTCRLKYSAHAVYGWMDILLVQPLSLF